MYTYTKMLHKYYKKTKKGFKNNHVEDINIFLKKKKEKKEKKAQHRYKNLSEEEQIKSQYHYDQMGSIK